MLTKMAEYYDESKLIAEIARRSDGSFPTQEAIADKSGISERTVGRCLKSGIHAIVPAVRRIIRAFEIPIEAIYPDDVTPLQIQSVDVLSMFLLMIDILRIDVDTISFGDPTRHDLSDSALQKRKMVDELANTLKHHTENRGSFKRAQWEEILDEFWETCKKNGVGFAYLIYKYQSIRDEETKALLGVSLMDDEGPRVRTIGQLLIAAFDDANHLRTTQKNSDWYDWRDILFPHRFETYEMVPPEQDRPEVYVAKGILDSP
jgi:hypothetical protein